MRRIRGTQYWLGSDKRDPAQASTLQANESAHFQATTEGLSVPHLMCWRTEGTITIARRCCDVFVILAPDIKLQTCLLTHLRKKIAF